MKRGESVCETDSSKISGHYALDVVLINRTNSTAPNADFPSMKGGGHNVMAILAMARRLRIKADNRRFTHWQLQSQVKRQATGSAYVVVSERLNL